MTLWTERCPFKVGDTVVYKPDERIVGDLAGSDLAALRPGNRYRIARIAQSRGIDCIAVEGFENVFAIVWTAFAADTPDTRVTPHPTGFDAAAGGAREEGCVGSAPVAPSSQAWGTIPAYETSSKTNANDGAEMILIPEGPFLVGDDNKPDNPRRTLALSAYYIYRNLVTVGMYKNYCRDTRKQMPPYAPTFDPSWTQDDHPMVDVAWAEAEAYARWAGASLPTEAQWEKAARGTDGRLYPWGNDWDPDKVWCSRQHIGDAGGTTPVGKYGVSPYGATDMAGNVCQWCLEQYHPDLPEVPPGPVRDAINKGEVPGICIVRGGSWYHFETDNFHCSDRFVRSGAVTPSDWIGFRCVLSADL